MSSTKLTFQVVKYKDGKMNFEIMTKPGAALKFREGTMTSLSDVLFSDEIYSDQGKGERAKDVDLRAAFETTNPAEVSTIILQKGDLQLSTSERKTKVDQKTKEIVNYIHKYYIDPRTKTPHPVTRIENAIAQMKINIDPWISAEKQFHDKIERRLPEMIPVKKCEITGTLKVPHAFVAVAQGTIKKWCGSGKEDWNDEGMVMEVSIVPGDYDVFCVEMNDITKGNYSFDVVGQGGGAVEDTTKGKYGKGKKGKGVNSPNVKGENGTPKGQVKSRDK